MQKWFGSNGCRYDYRLRICTFDARNKPSELLWWCSDEHNNEFTGLGILYGIGCCFGWSQFFESFEWGSTEGGPSPFQSSKGRFQGMIRFHQQPPEFKPYSIHRFTPNHGCGFPKESRLKPPNETDLNSSVVSGLLSLCGSFGWVLSIDRIMC